MLSHMEPNRQELERRLKSIFWFDTFYDDQWKTISAIMKGRRILLIEKTGFWKSLAFQFPATQFSGITIIFSPLIALMRDQVSALAAKGIPAWLINSEQTLEQNLETIEFAKQGRLKILYIAPERQENEIWQNEVRKMKISFVVIDEAHCISSWGHDFRPAFRRIRDLTRLLPSWVPVLATTATATKDVASDIAQQIGGDIEIIRGDLSRPNLRLWTVLINDQDDKLEAVSQFIRWTEWNGIVYVWTRNEAEMLAKWCDLEWQNVIHYHARIEPERRMQIERDWKANRYKAIISTNALGMGIDKPDIGFIIHTQIPQSPVHYYQEIGRAWRDGNTAQIVLLYDSAKDRELPESFIEWAKPSEMKYRKVIEILRQELCGEKDVCKKWNIKSNQWRTIKADLIEQGVIKEVLVWRLKKFQYQYGAKEFDFSAFREIRQRRMAELEKMIEYVSTNTCKMQYLCDFLWNVRTNPCGICCSCIKKPIVFTITQETRQKIEDFKAQMHPTLETASEKFKMMNGIAWGYYGFTSIWGLLHESKYVTHEDFPNSLIKQTLAAYYSVFRGIKFDVILFIPPTKSGPLVENFARKIGSYLWIPVSKIYKTRATQEQKGIESNYWKEDNIIDAFDTNENVIWKKVLIIDDIYDSGHTMKEVGRMLAKKGVEFSAPLAIAKTVSGDSI